MEVILGVILIVIGLILLWGKKDSESEKQNDNSTKDDIDEPQKPTELLEKYENLRKIKGLHDDGILTKEEFERERHKILNSKKSNRKLYYSII